MRMTKILTLLAMALLLSACFEGDASGIYSYSSSSTYYIDGEPYSSIENNETASLLVNFTDLFTMEASVLSSNHLPNSYDPWALQFESYIEFSFSNVEQSNHIIRANMEINSIVSQCGESWCDVREIRNYSLIMVPDPASLTSSQLAEITYIATNLLNITPDEVTAVQVAGVNGYWMGSGSVEIQSAISLPFDGPGTITFTGIRTWSP